MDYFPYRYKTLFFNTLRFYFLCLYRFFFTSAKGYIYTAVAAKNIGLYSVFQSADLWEL